MNVIFRVDSSVEIGTGHIFRCLSLADLLRCKGVNVFFICRILAGNLSGLIESKGFIAYQIPLLNHVSDPLEVIKDAAETQKIISNNKLNIDWLIVDHYSLDIVWESRMRPNVGGIMVIDDLANRPHDCDVLLDQNFYHELDKRYAGLVPKRCKQLLGPKHVLLRSEFKEIRNNLRKRTGVIERIHVFYGGSDPTGETLKTLDALRLIEFPTIRFDIIVGKSNPLKEKIERICKKLPNTSFYCQVSNMAELMNNADLAIGAGGSTTWERCILGLPSLIVAVAQNQIELTKAVADFGATIYLGTSEEVTVKSIAESMNFSINNPAAMQKLSERSLKLMEVQYDNSQNDLINILLDSENGKQNRL